MNTVTGYSRERSSRHGKRNVLWVGPAFRLESFADVPRPGVRIHCGHLAPNGRKVLPGASRVTLVDGSATVAARPVEARDGTT